MMFGRSGMVGFRGCLTAKQTGERSERTCDVAALDMIRIPRLRGRLAPAWGGQWWSASWALWLSWRLAMQPAMAELPTLAET